MKSKLNGMLMAGLAALLVAAVFLFAALWVNGNFPVHIAFSVAVALGVGTYCAMPKYSAQKTK